MFTVLKHIYSFFLNAYVFRLIVLICIRYRAPFVEKPWIDKFKHVVGIIHTNYLIYTRGYAGGAYKEPMLHYVNQGMCRANCHKIIKLSGEMQYDEMLVVQRLVIHLSIYRSIDSFIHSFMYRFIYLFIHPYINPHI